MGAGLLLAGVAGAAVVHRRRSGGAVPPSPAESEEYQALEAILKGSVEYNEALYGRICNLEKIADASARPHAVEQLMEQNRENRAVLDSMRASLQTRLESQGCTFADIDGFVPLLSKYRIITLEQQKRHLEVYRRVRRLENVTDSPELHAYIKLSYSDEAQKRADTEHQLQLATEEQRAILLRVGRVLSGIENAEAAAASPAEINELGKRYMEISQRIALYKEDDPIGAVDAIAALKSMYTALTPPLKEQVARLRTCGFYGCADLEEILNRLLP